MTVRVGWHRTSERARLRRGGGVRLFQLFRAKDGRAKQIAVGVLSYDRADLEALRESGLVLDITVIGVLLFGTGVTPALLDATVRRVKVVGRVVAPSWVRTTLEARTGVSPGDG